MIYTVTFNPSLDYIFTVDDFQLGITNRTTTEQMLPGGKGINVSIVLKNLGFDSTALGFIAGFTGDEIVRRLQAMGLHTDFIRISEGMSRINLKLKSVDGTEINGMGPVIGKNELDALMSRLDRLTAGDTLFLAGSIPASMPDDMVKARKLLDSNLTNRTLHPLDYARCIEYYITYVLKPSGFKGDVDSQCAEYFNKSRSAIYKYRSIVKMIPELQELANDPQFPFTGFVSAHRLSEEMQKKLYEEIKSYPETHLDKDGNPMEVSRSYIEQTVTRLLKEEDRYKEAANKAIRDRNIEKAQEREAKEAEKASIIVNRSDNIDNIQSIEPSSDDSTGEDDVAPLPGQYSEVGGQMPLPVDDSSDDNTGYEADHEGPQEVSHDVLSQFPDTVGSDATSPSPFSNTSNRSDPFENNSPRLNEAPESSPAEVHSSTATSPIEEQSEIFQKINVIGAELDQIVASYNKISDKIRLKALLTPLKDRIDSVLNSIEV